MTAPANSKTSCKCNQVVFDLEKKDPGHEVNCPWCKRRYRLDEQNELVEIEVEKADEKKKKESGRGGPGNEKKSPEKEISSEKKEHAGPSEKSGGRKRKKKKKDSQKDSASSSESRRSKEELSSTENKKASGRTAKERPGDRKKKADSGSEREEGSSADKNSKPLQKLIEVSAGGTSESVRSNRTSGGTEGKKPITLETLVVYMFGAAVPLGALAYALYMWWAVRHGYFQLRTLVVLGVKIDGNNPWVWVAGILVGGLVFFMAWVGHTYFFVFLKGKHKSRKGKSDSERVSRARFAAQAAREEKDEKDEKEEGEQ